MGYTKPETQRLYRQRNPERVALYAARFKARLEANPELKAERLRKNAERVKHLYATDPDFKASVKAYHNKRHTAIAPEAVAEEYLRSCVELVGGMCPKFIDPSRRGAPDRMVMLPGSPIIFVEMKRMKMGKVQSWQARYQADLRALGHRVEVLWSKEDVDAFLASI